jgi:probable rRNA maturation factor
MSETFSFADNRPRKTPKKRFTQSRLFESIKNAALGKRYELSLVFLSKPQMRRINRIYRGKDKPTNILSFPLDKKSGEIFICPAVIEPAELMPLFIHGLVHLKGFDHGSKMEREERQILKEFGGV